MMPGGCGADAVTGLRAGAAGGERLWRSFRCCGWFDPRESIAPAETFDTACSLSEQAVLEQYQDVQASETLCYRRVSDHVIHRWRQAGYESGGGAGCASGRPLPSAPPPSIWPASSQHRRKQREVVRVCRRSDGAALSLGWLRPFIGISPVWAEFVRRKRSRRAQWATEKLQLRCYWFQWRPVCYQLPHAFLTTGCRSSSLLWQVPRFCLLAVQGDVAS